MGSKILVDNTILEYSTAFFFYEKRKKLVFTQQIVNRHIKFPVIY